MTITVRTITFILVFILQLCTCFAAGSRDGITRLGYSIQVGAFSEVKNAERLTNRLQGNGIEAFYFKKDDGVYAVRFGDFATYDAARKAARKLVGDKMIDSFFIAVPKGELSIRKNQPEIRNGDGKKPKKVSGGEMGPVAARTAERFVGIPYRWGGNNVVEGMDCSGFVRAVFNLCGVIIPRTSREQFKVGESIPDSELADGDLVFFGLSADQINHVGIYVGAGRFVHAPRRGDDIKISSLDDPYFSRKFVGAKRYF
jgi:nitrogen regulatory protein PII-like uncharacterized protein